MCIGKALDGDTRALAKLWMAILVLRQRFWTVTFVLTTHANLFLKRIERDMFKKSILYFFNKIDKIVKRKKS